MTKLAMFLSTASRRAIVAASLSLCAGAAYAGGERHGWYVGLDVGASWVNEINLEGTPNEYTFDTGWAALGSVGYKFRDPSLRLEFEGGLRNNDIDQRNGISVVRGELQEISGFANLLWDHSPEQSNWGLTIGGGIGIDNVRFRDHVGIESRDFVQATQGIIGLNYKCGDHWDAALTYRVMFVDSGTYDTTSGPVVLSGEGDAVKHALTLGFKYGYDDPPPPPPPPAPPPPPPPPPPQAKQFIVFFGFGKANLTAEAQAVVTEAAAAAKTQGSARIVIVGHTDTVGSAAANESLSLRRANAVKDELTRLGISSDAISTSGKGETELMVQTGDGVKEPQNRRATIDLN